MMMIPNIVHAVNRLERVGVVLKEKTGPLLKMSMSMTMDPSRGRRTISRRPRRRRRRHDGMDVPTVVYILDHGGNSHHHDDDEEEEEDGYDFNGSFLFGDIDGDENETCHPTVLPRDIVERIMTRTIEDDCYSRDTIAISESSSSTSTSISSSS
jgi:hypothetical protein